MPNDHESTLGTPQPRMRLCDCAELPGPTVQLCWAHNADLPYMIERCDRQKGHSGILIHGRRIAGHSWELYTLLHEQEKP